MKRKSFIAALLLLVAGVQTAWAQSVIVNMKDEGTSVFNLSDVESISFSESDFAGGFEYVDLDLPSGTLWATCNVGAESPEEFGDYFAWGETNRKWEYSWAMYQYIFGDNPNALTRYCNQSGYGYQGLVDGITELLPEDDAATAYWGNKWQTPDVNQFKELFNEKYTTSEWTTLNGKNGRKVTSKSNGMSIFLPAAGYHEDMSLHYSENYGYYWSRSLGSNDPTTAFQLFFNSDEVTTYGSFRYLGLSVRPVCIKKKKPAHEYVDLGLPSGTLWATTNVGADSPEEYGDYFAWGETATKSDYDWDTYQYCNGSTYTMTKYCIHSDYGYNGFTDGQTELLPEDDAATANWGNEWQMPTYAQLRELVNSNYTTSEWITLNGVEGRKITSRSNGKSIFLPAEGIRHDRGLFYAGSNGLYWSRSLLTDNSSQAYYLDFNSDDFREDMNFCNRDYGQCVRPVRKQEPKEHEYVDLGLPSGTLWATTNVGADSPEEYGDYFAWGETETKEEYNWSTYKYCEKGNRLMTTKYRVNSPGGTIDNKSELDPEDDAATVNWGSEWQMPSLEQLKELFNESFTTSENTMLNNVEGVLVSSLTNGNSIFLPKAGRYNGVNYYADGGSFWSRNLDLSDSYDTKALHTWFSGAVNYGPYERYQGLSVRPVVKY